MARLLLLTTDDDARDPGAPVRTIGEVLNDLCDELDTGRRRPPGPTPDDVSAIAGFLGLTRRQSRILQGWLNAKGQRAGSAPKRDGARDDSPALAIVGGRR